MIKLESIQNLKDKVSFIINKLNKLKILSDFLLRLILGIAFLIHGFGKFPLPPQKLIDYFNFSPILSSFVALSEIYAGFTLILAFFFKNSFGDILTRLSGLLITIIMIFAFYLAHKDWFITTKLFTSEQIFLFILGLYFLINGNKNLHNL